jgi:hypothetical protein
MKLVFRRRRILPLSLVMFAIISLVLSSCSGQAGTVSSSGKTFEVAPGFREFYQTLGGSDVLGPAISESFAFESQQCQYTVNVLMCMDPAASDASRFSLYSLGIPMSIREDPAANPAQGNGRIINGYEIYEEFLPAYDKLSGALYAGNPLTQVHLNYAQQRIEQYFEKVGFYRKFSDPPGEVHLLAYGSYSCESKCSYSPSVDALVINSNRAVEDQPFLSGLGRISATTIFGKPLTQPYIAADGNEEQVYENAVLYAPPGDLANIKLRSLPVILNEPRTDPGPKVYGSQDGVVFYPTAGELGYHVPLPFDTFISAHGGLEFSGKPIDEVFEVSSGVYRQCFENYCMDYSPNAAQDIAVTLAPLGKAYLDQLQSQSASTELFTFSPDTVSLQVGEQYKMLAPDAEQKLEILVLRKSDGQPLANLESDLDLTLPDGSHYTATLPATQSDGKAAITIPAGKDYLNGSILVYQVCLKAATTNPVCASGSYILWKAP